MTMPPSQGPPMLQLLNADVVVAPASVGAAFATLNMRALSAGAVKKAVKPSSSARPPAATGLCAVSARTLSTTVEAVMPPYIVPNRCASAIRPPTAVPISAPTPNSASTVGTQPSSSPATSVSSGPRYENRQNTAPPLSAVGTSA